ncbi:MAG TPA: polyprenyl synthetase family protein [Actinomycetota bacterium]
MTTEPALQAGVEMEALTERVDRVLASFLQGCALEMEAAGEGGRAMADEIQRLLQAGGKRLRPAFCYWGFRAAGGPDGEPIVRASAAMELLHTMALVHDDLLDHTAERRGAPTTGPKMAGSAPILAPSIDPQTFGTSAAVVVGDLAAVLADRLLLESGFEPAALERALDVYHRMRIETAVGQFLDVAGRGAEPARAREVARLKGGAYTVEGPLLVGAAFADGGAEVRGALGRYGRALGEAFQLRDDLHDDDAASGVTVDEVNGLVERARGALGQAPIDPGAARVLDGMAGSVAMA